MITFHSRQRVPFSIGLVIIVVLTLSSCHVYTPYVSQSHDYQTYLPIEVSGSTKTRMFFEGDQFPNKPHIVGGEIGVIQPSHRNSKVLATELRQKASELGYDAVVDIQKHIEWKEEFTIWDYLFAEDGEVYPSGREYAILSGKGIKFVENMHYLDMMKRSRVAWRLKEGVKDTLFVKSYFPDGEFRTITVYGDEAQKIHDDVIIAFDLQRLIYEEDGWEFVRDQQGRVILRRNKRFDDWILEKVRIKYDGNSHVMNEIVVTIPPQRANGLAKVYSIQLSYDDQGRISGKEVANRLETLWTEELFYDDQGRITQSILRRPHWVNEEIVMGVSYYRSEDLPDLIKEFGDRHEALTMGN